MLLSLLDKMMKRRFKKVMSYFFNFDSINTPRKKSRKAAAPGGTSRDHLESESQYVIRKLSEGNSTPRENVSFSRYTPLPRIGETVENKPQQRHDAMATGHGDTPASHIITYKFSPVRVHVPPPKVSYQLSPLPAGDHSADRERAFNPARDRPDTRSKESFDEHSNQKIDDLAKEWRGNKSKERTNNRSRDWLSNDEHTSLARPRLKRQGTYVVREPVFIKGSFLEYLRHNDNMVTTRVHPPEKKSRSTSKRNGNAPKHSVAKVSNSKQRLNEVKANFKRQQEELRARAHAQEQGFWLEL